MYLHSRNIAHLDICLDNFVYDYKTDTNGCRIPPGSPYFIDFETSQELPLGPGRQPAIELPPSQYPKPGGLTRLDPYSWDMYCVGILSNSVFQVCYHSLLVDLVALTLIQRVHKLKSSRSRVAGWYVRWLMGDERGCAGVCHCRPRARQARRVLVVVRWVVCWHEFVSGVVRAVLWPLRLAMGFLSRGYGYLRCVSQS